MRHISPLLVAALVAACSTATPELQPETSTSSSSSSSGTGGAGGSSSSSSSSSSSASSASSSSSSTSSSSGSSSSGAPQGTGYESGSRLKAKYWQATDGAKQAFGDFYNATEMPPSTFVEAVEKIEP